MTHQHEEEWDLDDIVELTPLGMELERSWETKPIDECSQQNEEVKTCSDKSDLRKKRNACGVAKRKLD